MRHDVTAEDAGRRTDVLVARLSGASRALVAAAIKAGTVTVNGEAVRASHALEPGDVLDYVVAPRPVLAVRGEAIDVPILFEDADLLVVDKPAGMVTHPAHGSPSGTLANAMLAHCGTLPGDTLRPGLVHRLDRDTSGLLLVAKNEDALDGLAAAMKARRIRREYLGLVCGVPEHIDGTIDGPIGRDPRNRLKYAIVRDGKPAITHYHVRETFARHAELLFRLETGRTHQIRVHLHAAGFPIVNDLVYGVREPHSDLPGQALHAWRLAFTHPRTGEALTFEVAPPAAYAATRDRLRA